MVKEKLSNKFQQKHKPVKDKKNRNPLATSKKQLKRWVDHYEELLKRPESERPPDKQPCYTDPAINYDIPTKPEIRRAISTLMNGPDEIHVPAEAVKLILNISYNPA